MDSAPPTGTTQTTFELALLGPPVLRDQLGQTPVGLGAGKPLALLCFLVVKKEVRRDEAIALLWGDVDESRARNAFRQALHRLRLAMGDDIVTGDRQSLTVTPDRLRVDLTRFDLALGDGDFEGALACYRGDFLEGLDVGSQAFAEWVELERARLRKRLQAAAERAVSGALADGRVDAAGTAVRKLLEVAPLDPRAVEAAATTLVSIGRRDEAAEVLQEFAHRSRRELGAPPPENLRVLFDRLTPTSSAPAVGEAPSESRFVGRNAELARLLALWRSVGDDSGATVVLEGPSGIGKSRLVREFADGVRAFGKVRVLHAVESRPGNGVPYAALASAVRPLARAAGVAGASPHLLAEAARILPELRDVFQLPALDTAAPVNEDTARLRMCEGIAALVEAAAYERPICLILEDTHRSAPPSLDLLVYLAQRLRRSRVLVLITFDPDGTSREVAARIRGLAGTSNGGALSAQAQQMSLGPLALGDARAIVARMAGPGRSAEVLDRLAERAEGNPLRAEELARLAREGFEPTALPLRLSDVIRERVVACSAVERRFLLAAALIGRPASLHLLAEAAHVPPVAASDAAVVLETRGLLTRQGGEYAPSSDAAAEAALDLAGDAARAFAAGWVADVLARDPHASSGEIVRLYAIAGRVAETYRSARAAGDAALLRGAIDEGVHFLTIARAFARTREEHEAVERSLAAHGAGRPRLPRAARFSDGVRTRAARIAERYFPHWRYLTAAAVAASLVAIAVTAGTPSPNAPAFASRDTLVVAKPHELRRGLVRLASASGSGLRVTDALPRAGNSPAWVDSLALPWINPSPSPAGQYVGVERISPTGSGVYLIATNRRDTIPLVAGDVEARAMGWSPDGQAFLVARRLNSADGDYRVGLFAFPARRGGVPTPIDTARGHSVTEAEWSPDGSRIAWVARVGEAQEEVFVAWTDGSHRRNLSSHPARDDHLSWSPDGSLVAFTSRRDGNADVYAYDLVGERLWRLTRDAAQDDRARFAGDGRVVAFESTRDGGSGVYVMPSLGGSTRRVGDSTAQYEIVGWRGAARRYIDRLELAVPSTAQRGETVVLRANAVDQFGASLIPDHAQWSVLDPGFLRELSGGIPASSTERRFVAERDGLARVAVSVGTWRADTAYLKVGTGPISLLRDAFSAESPSNAWRVLGEPRPSVRRIAGRPALLLNADRLSESGALSRVALPLLAGFEASAMLLAPFQVQASATSASFALVAPDPPASIDESAPTFMRLISIGWDADARRFIYAAEREVFAETIPDGSLSDVRTLRMAVNNDGTVTFFVDGVQRWRSTVRVLRAERAARVQLWLGGQDTGARVAFTDVNASLRGQTDRR